MARSRKACRDCQIPAEQSHISQAGRCKVCAIGRAILAVEWVFPEGELPRAVDLLAVIGCQVVAAEGAPGESSTEVTAKLVG